MPMEAIVRLRRRTPMGEEERAASSVVLAVTASVGVVLVLFSAVDGTVALIGLPTAALLVGMARRAPVASAWCALAAWVTLLPVAGGTGVIAPLLMIVMCLALAVGPGRVLGWAEGYARLGPLTGGADTEAIAWIEDDPRFS
jgi:hypothetical protein